MRTLSLVIALIFVCVCSFAQGLGLGSYKSAIIFNNKTYADSQTDTSGSNGVNTSYAVKTVGGAQRLTYQLNYGDSIDVYTLFRYRSVGVTTWTSVAAAAGDSSIDTGTAGYGNQIVLRDNTTERIPGVAVQIMIISKFRASANSANSAAKYTGRLHYSP